MPRLVFAVMAAAFLLIGLAPGTARAWDPEADRAVARLAYERLTPAARAKLDALFGEGVTVEGCRVRSLADSADFVDCLHGGKADFMRALPYDLIPLCGPPSVSAGCPGGVCASVALKHFIGEFANPATPRLDKVLALEATAYLMSELHQPLHDADNGDRSGDRVRVILPGALKAKASLYSIWDNDLVSSAIGGSADTGLPYLRPLADANAAAWSHGDIDAWVIEGHDVALHTVYGRLPQPPPCGKLPDQPEGLGLDYFAAAVPAVREQLAKAAVRLAAVLNASLS